MCAANQVDCSPALKTPRKYIERRIVITFGPNYKIFMFVLSLVFAFCLESNENAHESRAKRYKRNFFFGSAIMFERERAPNLRIGIRDARAR